MLFPGGGGEAVALAPNPVCVWNKSGTKLIIYVNYQTVRHLLSEGMILARNNRAPSPFSHQGPTRPSQADHGLNELPLSAQHSTGHRYYGFDTKLSIIDAPLVRIGK
ncbi:hypothetical protein H2248_001523 [Termitomyces sp. 'cryptogamus']|nr:hypothetical protein H2248_001523 [Termitomyces sp. 'cryptogamus']